MGHDHDHPHGHAHVHVLPGIDPRRALALALALNGGFLGIEVAVGWVSGSLALLSDAAHMLSDVGALVLALGAAQLATRAATAHSTYGLARAEVLGAFLNGLSLLIACGGITWEAVRRLSSAPQEVPGVPVLVVGLIGLAINLGSAWALHRVGSENLNVRGALFHMLADALGSVAAVAAAVLLLLGFQAADPLMSLAVAALVAWGAVRLLRDSGRVLLELPPPGLDVGGVRDALLAVDGVVEVHDLHAWSLDGHTPLISAHLVIAEGVGFEEACARAQEALHDGFDVEHATLQPERGGAGCHTNCGVEARVA